MAVEARRGRSPAHTARRGLGEGLRVVWAITAKDILDALRNKNTLVTMISVLFVMAYLRVMPVLMRAGDPIRVRIYDAGAASLVTALESSTRVNVRTHDSQQEMEERVGSVDVPELGLVIPADFEQVLSSGGTPTLEGYVVHWASDADVEELRLTVEQEIAERLGRPVRIDVQSRRVYPQPDSTGRPLITSLILVVTVTWIGLAVVPHLMIEEKETRTLEALLVSPATSGQVVIAKALTGLFYCLTAAAVVFAVSWVLITHWGLAILATVLGSLFGVSAGLLLGSLVKLRQQLTVWGLALTCVLLWPVFLSVMAELLPDPLAAAVWWAPPAALAGVLRIALAGGVSLAHTVPGLALVSACTALLLAAVTWVVRRSDR